ECGSATPITEILGFEAEQQRTVRHARPDLPQAVLRDAETKPAFEHFAGLFENNYLEPFTDSLEGGRWRAQGESSFANQQDVKAGKVSGCIDRLVCDTQAGEPFCRFAGRIEQCDS